MKKRELDALYRPFVDEYVSAFSEFEGNFNHWGSLMNPVHQMFTDNGYELDIDSSFEDTDKEMQELASKNPEFKKLLDDALLYFTDVFIPSRSKKDEALEALKATLGEKEAVELDGLINVLYRFVDNANRVVKLKGLNAPEIVIKKDLELLSSRVLVLAGYKVTV